MFASGSPYPPVVHNNVTLEAGQGNNMYIFPGIGLGSILSKAKHISDSMVTQASIALSESLNEDEVRTGLIYPRLDRIRTISSKIATAVIRQAQKEVRRCSGVNLDFVKRCSLELGWACSTSGFVR